MSTYIYTVMYNAVCYSVTCGVYGVGKVASSLKINKERVRRGADLMRAPALTSEILAEIQKADGVK